MKEYQIFFKTVISFSIFATLNILFIKNASAIDFPLKNFRVASKEITVGHLVKKPKQFRQHYKQQLEDLTTTVNLSGTLPQQSIILRNDITQSTCKNITEFIFAEHEGWFTICPLCNNKCESGVAFLKRKEMNAVSMPKQNTIRFMFLFTGILDILRTIKKPPAHTKQAMRILYRAILKHIINNQISLSETAWSVSSPNAFNRDQVSLTNIRSLFHECMGSLLSLHIAFQQMIDRIHKTRYILPSPKREYIRSSRYYFHAVHLLAYATHNYVRVAINEYRKHKFKRTHAPYFHRWIANTTAFIFSEKLIAQSLALEKPLVEEEHCKEPAAHNNGDTSQALLWARTTSAEHINTNTSPLHLLVILFVVIFVICAGFNVYRQEISPWLTSRTQGKERYTK